LLFISKRRVAQLFKQSGGGMEMLCSQRSNEFRNIRDMSEVWCGVQLVELVFHRQQQKKNKDERNKDQAALAQTADSYLSLHERDS
jgi:hypothetical protein